MKVETFTHEERQQVRIDVDDFVDVNQFPMWTEVWELIEPQTSTEYTWSCTVIGVMEFIEPEEFQNNYNARKDFLPFGSKIPDNLLKFHSSQQDENDSIS
jgi:hypothetical protein